MSRLPLLLALTAAALFIAVSATMNSLFLGSLGRTPLEAGLFAAVSIAADLAKAVLPVALLAALARRLLLTALAAAALLVAVVALSLASGTGFAAASRSAAVSAQAQQAARKAQLHAELAALERRLEAFPAIRPLSVIEADRALARLQRLWETSSACTRIGGPATRRFCAEATRLDGELAASREREVLEAARATVRQALVAAASTSSADPQVAAVATLLGWPEARLRAWITVVLAGVIELGAVGLILIVAGPALRAQPARVPTAAPGAGATIPVQADLQQFLRQQGRRMAARTGGDGHGA